MRQAVPHNCTVNGSIVKRFDVAVSGKYWFMIVTGVVTLAHAVYNATFGKDLPVVVVALAACVPVNLPLPGNLFNASNINKCTTCIFS